jgi:hypothetical protein
MVLEDSRRVSPRASPHRPGVPFGPSRPRRYARRVPSAVPASWSHRAAVCLACLALLLGVVGSVSAPVALSAGFSGGGALSELTESQPETTSTATTPTTAVGEESSSSSKSVILLATGGALLLLVGITFFIVRDMRRVAPVGDEDLIEASTAQEAAIRVRKRRAKAKAARQQRKRNRSR